MLSLISASAKLHRFIKQYAEFRFRLGQLHRITTVRHRIHCVANPSLEILKLKTIEKQNFNEGDGSYPTLRIRVTDK